MGVLITVVNECDLSVDLEEELGLVSCWKCWKGAAWEALSHAACSGGVGLLLLR